METPVKIGGMSELVLAIGKANQLFRDQAQRQVNTSLTLRNWIIGFYIVEYEQNGKDRAEYGERLIRTISERLRDGGIKGLSYRSLQLFYETEAVVNNWSVRDLQRVMDSMLFERTGLSKDKRALLEKHRKGAGLTPDDIFRSPYMLDFLGLEEKPSYVETDLEGAIIAHLQTFLLEMGRGFCFEARQKRITFDNTHYRIDLVFYHRLLRCHVLIDLLCCAHHNKSYVA